MAKCHRDLPFDTDTDTDPDKKTKNQQSQHKLGDVHILLNAGILQKTDKGQIEFPFDAVHVDFMLKEA